MRDYKKPKTKKDMRAFLGSAGYYRRIVKNFTESSAVLTPATSSKAPGKVIWTPEMDDAFAKLCIRLCDMCVLHVPSHSDQFILHTDASGRGIGGVLNVQRDDGILPVAFYSRQLRGAEVQYSATEVEALAVVCAVQHFLPYLYGRHFRVVIDHQALTALMSSKTLNRRLQGMALKLMQFDFEIVYRPGDELERRWIESPGVGGQRCTSGHSQFCLGPGPSLSGGCGTAHHIEKGMH